MVVWWWMYGFDVDNFVSCFFDFVKIVKEVLEMGFGDGGVGGEDGYVIYFWGWVCFSG